MRTRMIAITALALAVQALGAVPPVRAADPVTVTFSFTGAEQSWVVPDGVTTIHVVLVGARGGLGSSGVLGTGGFGARVEGDLAVSAGQTLYVVVGGGGESGDSDTGAGGTGGFNGGGAGGSGLGTWGGGGGGGASDIRLLQAELSSRIIIAAGGGGAGTRSGGDAGSPGAGNAGQMGGAGTASAGGAGGTGSASGSAGAIGVGGSGGNAAALDNRGGGGGGGGLFGGGGAGSSPDSAGGGGGSSFTDNAWSATVAVDATGTPLISITYVAPLPSSGTVDAVVTMASSAVCLELSTTAIDFGTRRFGETGAPASPLIGVTNCSGIGEVILARGTDATGPGGAAWSLATSGVCQVGTLGTDAYRLRLESQVVPDVFVNLGTENATLQALAPGATADHEAQMDTPCPGSSGAGAAMTLQVVFTAIEEVAP